MHENNDAQPRVEAEEAAPGWLARNGIPLFIIAAIIGALVYYQVDLAVVGIVAVGLGLVIFIHEVGHFVAAKLCDVHVEAFSIGFGPSLPGCEFQWGETTYKVGMIPLGGYVKMVGEGTDTEEGEDDPRSYKNKSVGQRMAIISAGVVMNMLLAMIGFVGVYMTTGEERQAGVIGTVEAGSPAWQIGLRSGTVLKSVGSKQNPYFDDVKPQVVLSSEGEKVPLTYELPGSSTVVQAAIEPKIDTDGQGAPIIGVTAANTTELRGLLRRKDAPFVAGKPASKAQPEPLKSGDRIIATTDAQSGAVKDLPPDPRLSQNDQRDYFELYRRMVDLAGKPLTVRVVNSRTGKTDETTIPPAFYRNLGMIMRMGQVVAVRDASPAARAGVRPRTSDAGDIIKQVEVAKPEGGVIRYVTAHSSKPQSDIEERTLDPMRLPFELEQWAATATAPKKVKLSVLRPTGHAESASEEITLDWDDGWKYAHEMQLSVATPLSIPGLGLAYRVESTIEQVVPDSVAEAQGLKPLDVIKGIQLFRPMPGKAEPTKLSMDLKNDQWAGAFSAFHQGYYTPEKIGFKVQHGDKQTSEVVLEPSEDHTWPMVNRGMIFEMDTRCQKASGAGEALLMGGHRTLEFTGQIYRGLKSIVTGRISFNKSTSGPITIFDSLYQAAAESFLKFVLFLSVLSVNLAVINFLPIPLLDGGHMAFLLYEKVRGRPAPESVRVAATFAGMALIGSLMLYVIVLDVMRYVF
ncbi:MAG: RIP metalloprotease RseP [Gemmataceae bacterium]